MNQPTHAWLAVEAFKTIQRCAKAHPTDKRKLDRLVTLLDQHLQEVVVAAWLPDSLIKDMAVGHIFKNSRYTDPKEKRFIVSREDLKKNLASAAFQREQFLDTVPADWWTVAYRVKDKTSGDLPTRVASVCQNARDMLKMGDAALYRLCDVTPPTAHASIAPDLLYTSRDVAVMMWMASHYIADAHMPFHCDSRFLASSTEVKDDPATGTVKKPKAHGRIEDEWGKQVPALFDNEAIEKATSAQIQDAPLPKNSHFGTIKFADDIPHLKSGDPWTEAVYICRASFALSFSLVPPTVAPVDDPTTVVTKEEILKENSTCCGEARFWDISRAIMHDAILSIAMFWVDLWADFVKDKD